MQLIWLKCDGAMLGMQQSVMVGVCYLPPENRFRTQDDVTQAMLSLGEELDQARTATPHVLLMGDLNAHIGALSECSVDHAIIASHPNMVLARACHSTSVNHAGRELLNLMSSSAHLCLTTGRGDGDDGQPTCREATRTEHIIMSPQVFCLTRHIVIHPMMHDVSDHAAVTLKLHGRDMPAACNHHVCNDKCMRHTRLAWKDDRRDAYGEGLLQEEASIRTLRRNISDWEGQDGEAIQGIHESLLQIVERAADRAGMLRKTRCPLAVARTGVTQPAWFDKDCGKAKAQLWRLHRARVPVAVYRAQKRKYRSLLARKQARWSKHAQAKFLDTLSMSHGDAFKLLRRKQRRPQSAVPVEQWEAHLTRHFVGQCEELQQPLAAHPDAAGFVLPEMSLFTGIVQKQLAAMPVETAPGFDGLCAPFLKYAVVKDGEVNVLLGVLSQLMHKMMSIGKIPDSWKQARISPLWKGEGDVSDPGKYRMLAVSSVLYRLYANVLRAYLTGWCLEHNVLPDTQFGFIPGRSTQQPMFILRHIVHAQRGAVQAKHRKVFTAFIDFKQAYDHIPRTALWHHLRDHVRLPHTLLQAVQGLYSDDSYVLVDGTVRCSAVHANKGVKQGCPLSPLLFALYVNDIGSCWQHAQDGVIKVGEVPATHVMYADDLTLLSCTETGLQHLVACLEPYALRKHLTVNVGKSQVMVFNSRSTSRKPSIVYMQQCMPVVQSFRYLGMLMDTHISSGHAASALRGAMFAAMRDAQKLARTHGIQDNPFAMCHLIRAFVLPHAMYACQVWGPEFLTQQHVLKSPVQSRMTAFLRYVLGVRRTVAADVVLHELCQLPLQFYWLRAVCRFWNGLARSRSQLLIRAAHADLQFALSASHTSRTQGCWSAAVNTALQEHLGANFSLSASLAQIDVTRVCNAWLDRWKGRWSQWCGDPRHVDTQHRERCTYGVWFRQGEGLRLDNIPVYLRTIDQGGAVRRSMAQLRLGNHGLEVEKGRFRGTDFDRRTCKRCQSGEVDDVYHLLFQCPSTGQVRMEPRHAEMLHDCHGDVSKLMQKDCAHFVHKCMRCVMLDALAPEGVGQANQL